MAKVVELYVQNIHPNKIAKELHIRRQDVLDHIEAWKQSAVGSRLARERSEELVYMMDEHYAKLIAQYNEIIGEVDNISSPSPQYLGQKAAAIRGVADLVRQRIDILQKSGLLDAAELNDEVERVKADVEKLLAILQEELCDDCKSRVWSRLNPIAGQVYPMNEH